MPDTKHELSTLSDKELYQKAKQFGKNALEWRRKFIGLLPEINRRQLYRKKGFSSIFEFAAKLSSVSREQVLNVIRLEKRFKEIPELHELLVSGEVSSNKLSRVVSVANKENQSELCSKLKLLSQKAVEVMVRDYRLEQASKSLRAQTFSDDALFTTPSKRAEENLCEEEKEEVVSSESQISLSRPASLAQLSKLGLNGELVGKLETLKEKGFDLNDLLGELLEKRDVEIEEEKKEVSEKVLEKEDIKRGVGMQVSRYIPVRSRRILQKEHGSVCSIGSCNRPSKQIHHTRPFAMQRSHDPRFLAPLCKEHHEIAHSINLKVQERRQEALL